LSRRNYAGILENLNLLNEQLKTNKDYNPNETEFQPATVSAWALDLRSVHNTTLDSKVATRNAYDPTTGILKRMNAVKA
jgi:hypothetical protein